VHSTAHCRTDGIEENGASLGDTSAEHDELEVDRDDGVRDRDLQVLRRDLQGMAHHLVAVFGGESHLLGGRARHVDDDEIAEPGRIPAPQRSNTFSGDGAAAGESFQIPEVPTPTRRAVWDDGMVPEFARRTERAESQLPVRDNAVADRRPSRVEDHGADMTAVHECELSQSRRAYVADEVDGTSQLRRQDVANGDVPPLAREVWQELRDATFEISSPGTPMPSPAGSTPTWRVSSSTTSATRLSTASGPSCEFVGMSFSAIWPWRTLPSAHAAFLPPRLMPARMRP